ncbi:hypothetical protein ACQY1Y_11290 [Microcystis ichthyoblabe FBCC-A1114]|uniref:hypothetical protein n=1 Tax=Microcystis TaxID=1125 RepID=UPI003D2A457A
MSQVLTLELSDEVYAALQQQAKILGIDLVLLPFPRPPFGEGLGVPQLCGSFPPELFKVLPQFSGGNH